MPPTLTPAAFAARWRGVTTTEKASAQSHFLDVCAMVGEPGPHAADPTGPGVMMMFVMLAPRANLP